MSLAVTLGTFEAFHTPVSITPFPLAAAPPNVECWSRRFAAPELITTASAPSLPELATHTLLTVTFGALIVSWPVMSRFCTVWPLVDAVTLPDGVSDEHAEVAPTV